MKYDFKRNFAMQNSVYFLLKFYIKEGLVVEEYKKMITGENYNPMTPYLISLRDRTRGLIADFNQEKDEKKRAEILKSVIGKMGEGCYITPNIFFDYGCNTELGERVYFNANCVILDCAKVTIGDDTFIGPNTQFYTPIHPLDFKTRNTFIETAKPIKIGKNCWLGGSVIVLPGVTIGDGCVIGAGAVVTKDIPKNSLAVGNPAKVIRTIEQK